jgi:hypothetical protein
MGGGKTLQPKEQVRSSISGTVLDENCEIKLGVSAEKNFKKLEQSYSHYGNCKWVSTLLKHA